MIAPIVSAGAALATTGTGAAQAFAPAKSVEAFSQSMERHSAVQVAANGTAPAADSVQQAPGASGPVDAVSAASPAPDAQAQSRAREALELNGAGDNGDAILNGLRKLRGVFDERENIVSRLMSSSATDTRMMMAMQMEVAHFTLLVDVTSKLTGKSTQAFDTLMKGQ